MSTIPSIEAIEAGRDVIAASGAEIPARDVLVRLHADAFGADSVLNVLAAKVWELDGANVDVRRQATQLRDAADRALVDLERGLGIDGGHAATYARQLEAATDLRSRAARELAAYGRILRDMAAQLDGPADRP